MANLDVSQPINIILDGTNYSHWAQAFQNFLRGCKLWKFVTSQVRLLVADEEESSNKFDV